MHDPRELAAVFAGGTAGALARVGVAEALPHGPGAFALGVLAGVGLDGDARTLAAAGLLGSCTTFSTWMADSRRLGRRAGAANLAASLVLGLLAVWLGRALVS